MQQYPQQQQQQQVIIVQQPAGRAVTGKVWTHAIVPSFPRGTAMTLGAVQLLFGFVSFLGASLAFVYLAYNYEIAFGYWCGVFYFVAASVSMHAGRRPTHRTLKHVIAWAVVAFIFAGVEFGLSVDGLFMNVNYPYYSETYVCWWWYWWATFCYYNYPAMEAANGLMLSVSGLEMLICLWLIVVSARALKQPNHHPQLAANTTALVEMQPAPHRPDQTTVTVIDTRVPSQQPQVVVTTYGPPPSYDPVSPPAYATN